MWMHEFVDAEKPNDVSIKLEAHTVLLRVLLFRIPNLSEIFLCFPLSEEIEKYYQRF